MAATLERIDRIDAPVVTADQMDLVTRTVAQGATDAELKLYLYDCARQGVHPLDRLLHFTKRGGKYTPVTSIDLMRTRAADSGEYAGSDDAIFGGDAGERLTATVTVYRLVQGQRCAFAATARWSEYFPGDQSGHMWKKMPHTMLAKCAEALALRKGFPRQLAGLYAKEELEQADAPAPRTLDAKPVSAKPEGFDDWWGDMQACGDEGQAALKAAWEASSKAHRGYLLDTNRDGWTALKARAEAVQA